MLGVGGVTALLLHLVSRHDKLGRFVGHEILNMACNSTAPITSQVQPAPGSTALASTPQPQAFGYSCAAHHLDFNTISSAPLAAHWPEDLTPAFHQRRTCSRLLPLIDSACPEPSNNDLTLALALVAQGQIDYRNACCPDQPLPEQLQQQEQRAKGAYSELQNAFVKQTAATAVAREYQAILCNLLGDGHRAGYLTEAPKLPITVADIGNMRAREIKKMIPLYRYLPEDTQTAFREIYQGNAHFQVQKFVQPPGDKTPRVLSIQDLLRTLQKDIIPLLPLVTDPNDHMALKQSIINLTQYYLEASPDLSFNNTLPLLQRLADLLPEVLSPQEAQPLQRWIQALLKACIPQVSLSCTQLNLPSFLCTYGWPMLNPPKLSYDTKPWPSPVKLLNKIDNMVLEGELFQALKNCHDIWANGLSGLTTEQRQAVKMRLDRIAQLLLTAMYNSIQQRCLPVQALSQQLEWLLRTLGEDAWSSSLSIEARETFNYLAQTIIDLRLKRAGSDPDNSMDELMDLVDQALCCCRLVCFGPAEALKPYIAGLCSSSPLSRRQQQLLRRINNNVYTRKFLPDSYKYSVNDMVAGKFDTIPCKVIQLQALMGSSDDLTQERLDAMDQVVNHDWSSAILRTKRSSLIASAVNLLLLKTARLERQGHRDIAIRLLHEASTVPDLAGEYSRYMTGRQEMLQAREYLQSAGNNPKLAALQPLVWRLAPAINALHFSSAQDYFSCVIHTLSTCSAAVIHPNDAKNYVEPLGLLAIKSWELCPPGNYLLPQQISRLQNECIRLASRQTR